MLGVDGRETPGRPVRDAAVGERHIMEQSTAIVLAATVTALVTTLGGLATLWLTNQHNSRLTKRQQRADADRAEREATERAEIRQEEREQQWRTRIHDDGVSALRGVIETARELSTADWRQRMRIVIDLETALNITRLYFPPEMFDEAEVGIYAVKSLTAETYNDGDMASHDEFVARKFTAFTATAQEYLSKS